MNDKKYLVTTIVLSHDGLKKAIDTKASLDGPFLDLLSMKLAADGIAHTPQDLKLYPARVMQLFVNDANRGQTCFPSEIDPDLVSFAKQAPHRRQCCNLTCGRELTEETVTVCALASRIGVDTGRVNLIGFVCLDVRCHAEFARKLCEFLTIEVHEVQSIIQYTCAGCKKLSLDIQFKVCSRCKQARYCNTSCQMAHWGKHRSTCTPK